MRFLKQIKTLFFVFVVFFFVIAHGATDIEKFQYAKKNYITAVFKNDKKNEVKFLKELIEYGKKTKQDIAKYKQELHRISSIDPKKTKKISVVSDQSKKNQAQKDKSKQNQDFFLIKTIRNISKGISIDFSRDVTNEDFVFSKKQENDLIIYEFLIHTSMERLFENPLELEGVDEVELVTMGSRYLIRFKSKIDPLIYYGFYKNQLIVRSKIKTSKQESVENSELKETIPLKQATTPQEQPKEEQPKTHYTGKQKHIVIDAGHGGKDPGAVGPNNEKEKDIVLQTSFYLANILKDLGYQVSLTRQNDRFLTLRERTQIANNKNADLFISIHANAAPKGRAQYAKGIETYFLSPARSERAKNVAALENKEDIGAMESYSSQDILLTLLNHSKIVASQKLAIDLQRNMLLALRKIHKKEIVDNGVREAPFWVLVGAQMPAVLVEMGYISHDDESQRLVSPEYQKEIAYGIAEGITSYFIHNR